MPSYTNETAELSGHLLRQSLGAPVPPLGRGPARAPAAGGGRPGARHRLRHRHRCPAGARTRRPRWRGRGSGRQPRHAGGGARRRPTITWRDGSALDLPLAEGERFDVVTCQQGLQFFPDRPPRPGRCAAPWPPAAGSAWRRGARPTRSRCSMRCSAVADVISAPSSINGTPSATAPLGTLLTRRRLRRRHGGHGHPAGCASTTASASCG